MKRRTNQRDNIKVCVRIRPLNEREIKEGSSVCVNVDDVRQNCVLLDAKPQAKAFSFDWVASRSSTQEEVFNRLGKNMVETCLQGYNCTVLAYGQTGAGKTYTMMGNGIESEHPRENRCRGLQPRVLDYLFDEICLRKDEDKEGDYLIKGSYFEIYNEKIMDLLNPSTGNLSVREDLKKGVFIEGVTEEVINNSSEALELLKKGSENRHIASTEMNFQSSRSHCVLTLTIESKNTRDDVEHITMSKFHFVDLAGSERQKLTKSSGQRLKEASNINKSLTVLGSVINALSEGTSTHIRYRDSKLTFLLKDSLGGNSKTTMIANISPAASSFSETLSTLKFAQRAKLIKNKASINQQSSGSSKNLIREIARLKEELADAKNLIATLEDSEMMRLKDTPTETGMEEEISNPKGASQICDELRNSNKNHLEVEVLLRESLSVIAESEKHLQEEVARKEEFLEMFNSLCDLHKENDTKTKDLLELYEKRMNDEILTEEDKDSNRVLLKENKILREIAQNAPLIMQVFEENLNLKEKLREFEVEDQNCGEFNVREKIEHNMIFLMEINQKLEESINFRKKIDEKIEKLAYLSNLTPEELEKHREENQGSKVLKKEIENLNFDRISLKQKNSELETRNFNLEENIEEKDAHIAKLEEEKETLAANYEKRIKELKDGFQEQSFSGKGKNNMKSLRQSLLNAKDEVESYKKKVEELEDKLRYQENHFELTLKQKEDMINLNRNALERLRDESENQNSSMKKQVFDGSLELMHDEMNTLRREKHKLSKKVADLIKEQENFRHNLERALEDKYRLQNELNEIKANEEQSGENVERLKETVKKLEVDVQREKLENKKLMGELETIQDSYAYSLSQISNLRKEVEKKKRTLSSKNKLVLGKGRNRSRSKSRSRSKNRKNKENEKKKKSGKMSARRLKFKTAVDNIQEALTEEREKILEVETLLETSNYDLKKLTHEYDALDKKHIKLQECSKEDKEIIEELKQKIDSKENELKEVKNGLKEEMKNSRKMKLQVLDLKEEKNILENNDEQRKIEEKENQDKVISLQKKVSEKSDEIHSITENFENEKMKNFDLKKHFEEEKERNIGLQGEIECLKEINNQLSQKIQEISIEMENLNKQKENEIKDQETKILNEAEKENREIIEKKKKELQKYVSDYSKFIQESEDEMKKIKEYSSKVVKEIKILEKRLKTKSTECDKLKQEVEYLKNEKSSFQKKINEYLSNLTFYSSLESKMRLNSIRNFTQNDKSKIGTEALTSKIGEGSTNSVAIIEPNETQFKSKKPHKLKQINNRLKNEITLLKDEKCILINKIFSLSKKLEHLKHQSTKMAKQFNRNLSNVKEPSKQDHIIMAIELQRKISENKFLIDCISRFQEIISNSRLLQDTSALRLLQQKNKLNIDTIVSTFEILVNKILKKESELMSKEFEIDANKLSNQIRKRELLLLRKKLEILETTSDKVTILSRISLDKENMKYISTTNKSVISDKKSILKKGKQSVDRGKTAVFNNRTSSLNKFKPKFTPNMKENLLLKDLKSVDDCEPKNQIIDLEVENLPKQKRNRRSRRKRKAKTVKTKSSRSRSKSPQILLGKRKRDTSADNGTRRIRTRSRSKSQTKGDERRKNKKLKIV